ncbi:MAG: ribosomal protein S18 acetylase RimI-like enzyme [Lentisphaeria bacterium]|jgi:ribosomal protein S18 acetylase RimI-like enzyme
MLSQHWDRTVTLRLYTDNDLPFMQALYASAREDELAAANFSPVEKKVFLQQQFSAQSLHYTQHYCADAFNIVEFNGEPVGRFFVDYWENEIRVVDITLMPGYRGKGLGSHLFNQLFHEANKRKQCVTIHVEHNNPAKKLYERLGFSLKSKTNDIYLLMEWHSA